MKEAGIAVPKALTRLSTADIWCERQKSNSRVSHGMAEMLDSIIVPTPQGLPVLVTTPGDILGLFAPGAPGAVALAGAVGPAVAAAVGPAVAGAIGPVAAAVALLTASLTNLKIARRNEHAISSTTAINNQLALLQPLVKEVAGFGPGLPGAVAPAPGVAALAIGAPIPSPPFPANVAALRHLTNNQLAHLSVLYNDTFGIVAGDLVQVRLEKFERWVQGLL